MIAYLDCSSGISGDMFLGAMIDAGCPLSEIEGVLSALKLRGVKVSVKRDKRGPISGSRVTVHVPKKSVERDFSAIKGMIRGAKRLPDAVRNRALDIFGLLAKAEARIHGERVGHIHFHEVGALDSIVDIVGAAAAVEFLGIDRVACSPVPVGSGMVKTRHGNLPLPAPATLELLESLTVYGSGVRGELTTPTGAAILRSLVSECGPMPAMKITKIGYGVGSRELADRPNVLRVVLGEPESEEDRGRAVVLEANVDDMSPQDFEPLMESLFAAGALDALFIPVHMKKNRPGVLVQALAPEGKSGQLADAMFRHSSTLGVRSYPVERRMLRRIVHVARTSFGDVHYKKVRVPGGAVRITPEFEDIKKAARKAGVGIEKVRRSFWAAIKE